MSKVKKVVLAYSGGLDTSVILKWLINTYQCDVVTMTANLGQPEDLSGVEEKAYKTGASKAYVLDLREEMAKDFVFPMVRSAASYDDDDDDYYYDDGDTVYITNTGAKYHRGSCKWLYASKIPISRSEAIAEGYTACKVCRP